MGYATVKHVPFIRSHAMALRVHDRAVPIRNRAPELRPLGNRRDADTYSIRVNSEGNVECVLYKTPVITFHKNGDVVVHTAGHNTVSTNEFIGHMLGIGAYCQRGSSVLVINEKSYIIGTNNRIVLRNSGKHYPENWAVMNPQAVTGYSMNRAKANIVRARYKQFREYVDGMLKVRTEELRTSWGKTFAGICIQEGEFAEYFAGTPETGRRDCITFDVSNVVGLTDKKYKNYARVIETFMELVQGGNDAQDYYQAFLYLAVNAKQNWGTLTIFKGNNLPVETPKIYKVLDEAILKFHWKEVLDAKELPIGKLPNPKYATWI